MLGSLICGGDVRATIFPMCGGTREGDSFIPIAVSTSTAFSLVLELRRPVRLPRVVLVLGDRTNAEIPWNWKPARHPQGM